MSETYIVDYFRGNKKFGGVFANDKLKQPDDNKIYILNLEDANEGGSHWTVLHDRTYFDSYGCVPTVEIAPFVDRYNTADYQGLSKESCGYFSLYVTDNITAGREPYLGMIPNKYQWNENILKEYFK